MISNSMKIRLVPYVCMLFTLENLIRFGNEPLSKCWLYLVIPFATGLFITIVIDIATYIINKRMC